MKVRIKGKQENMSRVTVTALAFSPTFHPKSPMSQSDLTGPRSWPNNGCGFFESRSRFGDLIREQLVWIRFLGR